MSGKLGISVGQGEYDAEAGKRYDENYDRIFGEARRKNAERSAEERAREAADAGKRHAAKVQCRTARMRIMGDKKVEAMAKEDEVAKKGI